MSARPVNDPAEDLMQRYWDTFAEQPGLSLERFLERVRAGEFGSFGPEAIARFLREVEAQILGNIEAMVEANPQLAPLREERVEETQRMIAELLERFAPGA